MGLGGDGRTRAFATIAGVAALGVLMVVGVWAPVASAAHVRDRACAPKGDGDVGVVDYRADELLVRPRGEVDAAMFFVDFPDAAASGPTAGLFDLYTTRSGEWYREVSDGKVSLSFRALDGWLRMPRASSEYFPQGAGSSFGQFAAYIRDAVALADPGLDFGGVEIVYIVAAPGSALDLGPAHFGPDLTLDGTRINNFVTFGEDTVASDPAAGIHSKILVHETGHEIGLPDYYTYADVPNIHENVSWWDPMGDAFLGTEFSAWSRRMLGWLGKRDFECVARGKHTFTLRALEAGGRPRGIYLRDGGKRAYVVEAREQVGFDSALCSAGVVAYRLDGRRDGDDGGLRVIPSQPDVDPPPGPCAGTDAGTTLDRAPFGPGDKLADRRAGVRIEVLRAVRGGYRVRVANGKS